MIGSADCYDAKGLLVVQFDDHLFVDRDVDFFALRNSNDLYAVVRSIEFHPGWDVSKILVSQEFFEVWRVGALFLHLDHVANLHLHGRNVGLLAVDGEVVVNNHLTAFTAGLTKAGAENNIVKTLFEHDDEVFTSRAFELLRFFEVVSKRLFHYAVDEFGFLLFL